MSLLQTPNIPQSSIPYSRPTTPGVSPPQIGFVGIGNMGYIMASKLATSLATHPAGYPPLLVWNRTLSKAEQLIRDIGPDKARVANDLAQVSQQCDIIFTSLANDAVVKSVYEQLAKSLSDHQPNRNKIFVETSTVYPTLAGELDNLLSSYPYCHLITCPVFGSPAVAIKSQLLIVMSGDYRSKKEVAYLLVPAVGKKVIDLGGDLEKAPTFKLIALSMLLGNLEILAEAFTMAKKSGIASENITELVKDSFQAPSLINYASKMEKGHFDGSIGFAIEGGIKDASHIQHLAAQHDSPMPITDIAHQHLLTARALHKSDKQKGKAKFETLDWSGLLAGTRVAAGLNGFDSTKDMTVELED
ncbi:hypothetical protein AMATHDRAFT_57330 [Amanita thiersii Skay4041]|uniref:6-phosphogluconate dehydrogenase NADP-binding domain-containing protein n=1 Tax=Amanita thiersii Skay4041 TaxID=703135 RepID=A0A2A9NX09_9AGAR|nr:hypothetical protein AMATHDRAFT_57330 [Amanita thiersii Skay4041]